MAIDLKKLLGENALTYLLQKIKQMKTELQSEIGQKSDFSGDYNDLTNKPTIPTKLPNPQSLTFTGGATGSYDGSSALQINIPAPSGMIAATSTELGGIQADTKESGDTVPAKIGLDNKLYVPIYPSAFKGATASAAGGSGLVPAPASGKQNQYLRGDGTWATPPDTKYSNATSSASGLMSSSDKSKLDGFQPASNYALKSDLSTVYKYKGSVDDDLSLPDDAEVGDVYNIVSSVLYGDGANVAWNGSAWDNLGATVDLSNYVEEDELGEIGNTEIDSIWNTVFSS